MITKGKLTSLDVMTDKQYSFIEAEAYIQGIKDSGAPDLYKALKETKEWLSEEYPTCEPLLTINKALAKVEGK